MNSKFDTAADIAGFLVDRSDVQRDVKREVQQSAIITALMRLRLKKGITQTQVAEQLGCDPSKVSKLESGNDLALRVADVLGYLRAVGASMSLLVHDEELPAAERIKQYVFAIHDQLEKLAVIAKDECDDQQLVEKIHLFYGEVLFNFLARFGSSFREVDSLVTLGEPDTSGTSEVDGPSEAQGSCQEDKAATNGVTNAH